MQRTSTAFLQEWLNSTNRKPLVMRGARQVGKTWLVRHLAQLEGKYLIEVNFERKPEHALLFSSNDPAQILLKLSASLNISIAPHKCLLFLDEIQAFPELLPKLRWFAEEMPELPVIAAGSLLEFVLAKHSFSMPVGRINYMHLEPLSFEEFLLAGERGPLLDYLKTISFQREAIPIVLHEQLMMLFKEYILIGGMPEAVSNWVNNRSLQQVSLVHHNLWATYRDDFAKYSGRIPAERLDAVMGAVPKYLGEKFVYSRIDREIQIIGIKQALSLLCKARACHCVKGIAANGLPLAAEIQEKYLKVILLDVGLCSASLGLSLNQLSETSEINLINSGGIAEQVTGQLLRTIEPLYIEPALYYWHRSEKGSNAEIDYIIQHRNKVIPIEVKVGSTGSLKSLHLFMGLKHYNTAVRINSDLPSVADVKIKDHLGNNIEYKLLSIPFYLISEIHRLIDESV